MQYIVFDQMGIYVPKRNEEMSHNVRDVSFQNITNKLLDFQCRADKLACQASEIYPIHLRRESCSYPLKAKSLVFYCHDEVFSQLL